MRWKEMYVSHCDHDLEAKEGIKRVTNTALHHHIITVLRRHGPNTKMPRELATGEEKNYLQ